MSVLEGKTVLITGAKGGLGTYVTNAFLDAGAQVGGVSRSIRGDDFPHPNFKAFAAELTAAEATRQLVADAHAVFGRIDVAIHLMGGYAGGAPLHDTDDDVLERMFDLNLRSAFFLFRSVIPLMRERVGGSILAIGSRGAVDVRAGAAAYSASKAGLIALVRAVAAENADRGISANIVLPGTMDTPANRAAMPEADYSKWVWPQQVARLLVSLSAGLQQVTGAVIPVYGAEV